MYTKRNICKTFNEFLNESKDNDSIYDASYYLEDFYFMDGMDIYSESQALRIIQRVIDYVKNISYPIKVYRGIDTVNPDDDYEGASWSTDIQVAEGFGNKIFVGLIPNQSAIDVEQTIRTRVKNPYEYELYVPNFDDVQILDTYDTRDKK